MPCREHPLLLEERDEVGCADSLGLVGPAARVEADAFGLEDFLLRLGAVRICPFESGRTFAALLQHSVGAAESVLANEVSDRLRIRSDRLGEIAVSRPLARFDVVDRRAERLHVVARLMETPACPICGRSALGEVAAVGRARGEGIAARIRD